MAWSYYKTLTIASGVVDSNLTNFPVRVRIEDDTDILAAAQRSGGDIAFFDSTGATQYDHELIDYFAGIERDGAYIWFCRPLAIRYSGTHDKTYVSYQNLAGDVHIREYNHGTNTWATHTILHSALDPDDDHSSPGILVRLSDAKLMAFYATHNLDNNYYMWVSTNAEDSSAGTETNIGASLSLTNTTYAQPWQLGGVSNDPIFVSLRADDGSDRSWYYTISSDGGSTWAAGTKFWDGSSANSYLISKQLGAQASSTRIDFFATPSHPTLSSTNSVYHFYYNGSAGTFHKSDGTAITLPATPANTTLVYDGSSDGRAWVLDCAHDGSNPTVLYQRSTTSAAHRLRRATWNGSSWDDEAIVDMGGPMSGIASPSPGSEWYSGLAYFDHDDTDTVYVSLEVSGIHQIHKYVKSGTWSGSALTTGGTRRRTRPVCPLNHSSELEVMFMEGEYANWFNYQTGISTYPLTGDEMRLDATVEVPSVLSGSDNTLRLYYGDAGASAQEDRAGTWQTADKLILHGREAYTCEFDEATNSKDNSVGDKVAPGEPPSVTTAKGFAFNFDGSDDDINFGTAINMAGWSGVTVLAMLESYGGSGSDEHCIISNLNASAASVLLRIDPAASHKIEAFVVAGTNVLVGGTTGTFTVSTGTGQTLVGFTYSSAAGIEVWKNTSKEAMAGTTGNGSLDATASDALHIGYYPPNAPDAYEGKIGTVLIANEVRSDAWIKAWCNTLKKSLPGDGFYTIGSQQVAAIGRGGVFGGAVNRILGS